MAGGGGQDESTLGREALAYAAGLHNLGGYLTGDASDADDLVQETYARALRAAAQFTPGSNLKAWLFRILRNTFLSDLRRRRASPVLGGLDTVIPSAQDAGEAAWLRDDVELDRLRRVVAGEIEAALRQLSEDARTVILLDLEGFTEVEGADGMGCAGGTGQSRLGRGRAAPARPRQGHARGG